MRLCVKYESIRIKSFYHCIDAGFILNPKFPFVRLDIRIRYEREKEVENIACHLNTKKIYSLKDFLFLLEILFKVQNPQL